MHCKDILCCLIIISSHEFIERTEAKRQNTSDVSSVKQKVELLIMFCEAKRRQANRRQLSSMCLKKWTRKYEAYCKALPYAGSKACLELKWRMESFISRHTVAKTRTKSETEYCKVGLREKPFNTKYQYCCEGHIKKKKRRNNLICCTKTMMTSTPNTTTIHCCNKTELSLKSLKKAGCCRDVLYDEEKAMCYEGTVLSKTNREPRILAKNSYTYKIRNNPDGANYREQFQISADPGAPKSLNSRKYVIIGCLLLIGCFGISWFARSKFVCSTPRSSIWNKNRFCPTSNLKLEEPREMIADIKPIKQSETDTHNSVNVDADENNADIFDEFKPEIRYNESNTNHFSNEDKIDIDNDSNKGTINKASQTGPPKAYNLMNSMGKPFCCRHLFTPATKNLQLPNSCVKLTLSEQDSMSSSIECFASTFSCLTDVYSKLRNVLTLEETIVSPAIEYVFPGSETLKEFGCIEMEIGRYGKDLHVWKIKSDQGKSAVDSRQEIPLKDYVNVNDKNLDAYYEVLDPGKIRIYIRHFCWLVCTVCEAEHYGFNLSAYIYIDTMPRNNLTKMVRLTMYILDDIQQLKDYRESLHEDERSLYMVRKIELPLRVKLEDHLKLRLRLFEETYYMWEPQKEYPAVTNSQNVLLHRITKCHKQMSNSQPFAMDMYFISKPYPINADIFIFEGVINISLDPAFPGIIGEIPDNSFIVTHKVDFHTVKKIDLSSLHARGLSTNSDREHPAGYIQQPVSSELYQQQQNSHFPSELVQRNFANEGHPNVSGVQCELVGENRLALENVSQENDLVFSTEARRLGSIMTNTIFRNSTETVHGELPFSVESDQLASIQDH